MVEKLTEEFTRILKDAESHWPDNEAGDELVLRAYALKFLQNGGAIQGFPGLCYFSETEAIFERHAHELDNLLATLMDDNDSNAPAEVIKGWDRSDPLAMKPKNRNQLVWRAFDKFLRDFVSDGRVI